MVMLRAAAMEDIPAAEALLRDCSLMGLDAGAQFGPQYILALDEEGALVGMAGIEVYGPDGLLRSVAVVEGSRSQGIGAWLTLDRIAWARSQGLAAVYLLTTNGEAYFARHGFTRVAREDAPAAVAGSHQWSSACPASSVAMKLVL
jgi:amino-acid N-acetyltransferase